ncbi:MAG: 16S rRNA processing protein RimM [Candidatus Riflebacteria bacterium]|nr:16S rRNA processing protein RimM [Candidatus Riflebacteria bacterium]
MLPPNNENESKTVCPADYSKEQQEFVVVGKIVKTVGLDGWVKVQSNSDFPERFEPGASFFRTDKNNELSSLCAEKVRPGKTDSSVEILFKGYEHVDLAKELIGELLKIPLSERYSLPRGTYYPDELKGLKVLSPEGAEEGEVLELEINVPSPYLTVKTQKNGEVLIPFKKVFIDKIDTKARRLFLKIPIETHIPAK